MNSAYIIGVAAAIVAGITFNLGLVIQKIAVNRTNSQAGLLRQILRSPTWLAGLTLQIFIGAPLNLYAAAEIGPVLLPGLMALGLIVLAIGAVKIVHERVGWVDILGILLLFLATALLPFSGLSVDLRSTNFSDPRLVSRLAFFTAAVAACILICYLLQLRSPRHRSILFAINSGMFYVESNLWIGILMGLFRRWGAGQFSPALLGGVALASAISIIGSLFGVINIQKAFQTGDATRVVPIQNAPPQILAFVPYIAVFQLKPPSPLSFPIAAVAVALIIIGSALLAQRQVALNAQPAEKQLEPVKEKV